MKLTRKEVESMNRATMLETLEDLTAFETSDIKRMTAQRMREELLALAEPEEEVKAKPAPKAATKANGKKETIVMNPAKLVVKEREQPARQPKAPKEMPDCLCGCTGEDGVRLKTRGGRFRPGHDARYHSAQKGGPKKQPRECLCECGATTRGGKYLPGHDAKHHSRLKREGEEAAKLAAMAPVVKSVGKGKGKHAVAA